MPLTRIYIDTNVLLDFYRSAPEPMSVFEEIKARKVALVTTEQTFDEVYRNRAHILAQVIESVKQSTKSSPYTTALIRSFPEFGAVSVQRTALEEAATSLVERLREMLSDIDKDPVFGHLSDLMMAEGHLTIRTNPSLIQRAKDRKALGKPPTSPDKWTVGDELIWQSLLEECPDNLIVVSRDKTFVENESLLKNEYERAGERSLVAVATKLGDALRLLGEDSAKIDEQERAVVLERDLTERDPCPACNGRLELAVVEGPDGDDFFWLVCKKCHKEFVPDSLGPAR